jgi:hypothetical protein
MSDNFLLPSKKFGYLQRLQTQYQKGLDFLLLEILETAKVFIRQAVDSDFGCTGHDMILFLPLVIFLKIDLNEQEKYQNQIRDDLNRAIGNSIRHEYCSEVCFVVAHENDSEYQQAEFFSDAPQVEPESLSFWQTDYVRVFISHSSKDKKYVSALKQSLKTYGMCAFVAHDDVPVMQDWEPAILNGLRTMEVMLLFITENFNSSAMTNQEIGFALARNVPILSLKFANDPPKGFQISAKQALSGIRVEESVSTAFKVYETLKENVPHLSEFFQSSLIQSFIKSQNFDDAKRKLQLLQSCITKLSNSQEEAIVAAFKVNSQLDGYYIKNNLTDFLKKTTGKEYRIVGDTLELANPIHSIYEDVPF